MAGIGDTLIATPLIHELRANFPAATIDVLAMWAGSKDLLESNPHVNRVFQKNLLKCGKLEAVRFLWSLRRNRYDLSINTHPQSRIHYRLAAWLAGAEIRISHEYDYFHWLDRWLVTGTLPQDYTRHSIENNSAVLPLIGARKKLAAHETAALAHSLETKELGLECGVQDQLASAYGGINLIEISDFPKATISPVAITDAIWWELEHRLVLTYIGKPHQSSEIHKMVIAGLGTTPHKDQRIEQLRQLAHQARPALQAGNFIELGRIFDANTAVQRSLHKNLVCDAFEDIIAVAGNYQALGCKVNGAGGDGGSIAILTNGDMSKKREMQKVLDQKGYLTLPVYLSRRGLRVWKSISTTPVESK